MKNKREIFLFAVLIISIVFFAIRFFVFEEELEAKEDVLLKKMRWYCYNKGYYDRKSKELNCPLLLCKRYSANDFGAFRVERNFCIPRFDSGVILFFEVSAGFEGNVQGQQNHRGSGGEEHESFLWVHEGEVETANS